MLAAHARRTAISSLRVQYLERKSRRRIASPKGLIDENAITAENYKQRNGVPRPVCGVAIPTLGTSCRRAPVRRHGNGNRHRSKRATKQRERMQQTFWCRCYSIISSARARIDGGTIKFSVFAVFRLITSSKVVGSWTGKSAGFVPARTLAMYLPAPRNASSRRGE